MKSRILIILFCLFACVLNAQTTDEKRTTWDYPVKPGTEEWERLKTERERIDAVQILKAILEKLSSEELVELCIIQNLTSDERLELLSEARKKFSEKIIDETFSSLPDIQSSVRIMASILDMENYLEFTASQNRQTTEQFIKTGMLGDLSLIDEIVRMTDNYINSKNQTQ